MPELCGAGYGSGGAAVRARALGALLLVALGVSAPASAEARALRFSHVTVEQGLSSSYVLGILEDRRGLEIRCFSCYE